jgi:tetratricopeptide (TPR) repeat protein
LIRRISAVALWMALAWVGYVIPADSYRANLQKYRVQQNMAVIRLNPEGMSGRVLARQNLELLKPYAVRSVDPEIHNYIGQNLQFLGRDVEALQAYQRALDLEPRPEIHYNVGMIKWRLGDREGAIEHIALMAAFTPLIQVPPPLQQEVGDRVEELRERWRKR